MSRLGGEVYGGSRGRTRSRSVQYSCACGVIYSSTIHVSVDATADPDLAARVRDGSLTRTACPACGVAAAVEIPVTYHDGERQLLALVLPRSLGHRELEERAALLLDLAREPEHAVPKYALAFQVVYGAEGLVGLLSCAGEDGNVHAWDLELADRMRALDEREAGLEERAQRLAEREAALEARSRKLSATDSAREPRTLVRSAPPDTLFPSAADTAPGPLGGTPGAREASDPAVARWALSGAPGARFIDGGRVRLLASLPHARLEALVGGPLVGMVQLFRLPSYPLVVIGVGLANGAGDDIVGFPLDIAQADDRATLEVLGTRFCPDVGLYDPERVPVMQREVEAPLEENVRQLLQVAEEHLATIPVGRRSWAAAVSEWRDPGFMRAGRVKHDLDEDSFALLPTPGTTRLAVGITAHWAERENEDYLIQVRSFPLAWWRRIKSRVTARAVEFGLALPERLVPVAIADGLARTRRELLLRMADAFAGVVTGILPNDLENEQVGENWRALLAEARALGVEIEGKAADLAAAASGAPPPPPADTGAFLRVGWQTPGEGEGRARALGSSRQPAAGTARPRPGRITAAYPAIGTDRPAPARLTVPDATPGDGLVVAGEIGHRGQAAVRRDLRSVVAEELVGLLDDKVHRRDAALELCRRRDDSALGPIFLALRRMTRAEAVKVLSAVVGFGDAAVPHLVNGLRSRKQYLRQGSALALGVLKSVDGIEPLCDLLVTEPTDAWREIARAIGEVGAGAVTSLATRARDPSHARADRSDTRERLAWALAHVAARGGRVPVETLAVRRDAVAAGVALRALELSVSARSSDVEVRGAVAPRDQTVNRAFSRRFFEAMSGRDDPSSDGASREAEWLDDADVLDDEEEILGDEDLIPG